MPDYFFLTRSTCREILSRQYPYGELTDQDVREGVRHGLRPQIPAGVVPTFSDLMKMCWAADPAARPTFGEVVTQLDDILETSGSASMLLES
jgi:hypothetical protein